MKSEWAGIVDSAAVALLQSGATVEIGMPAWAAKELFFRKSCPLTGDYIAGLNEEYLRSMLEEYEGKLGYSFSWGTVSESFCLHADLDIEGGGSEVRFEFFPKAILLAFPQPQMLQDLFDHMYSNHPLRKAKFPCDEPDGDWSVIAFRADGGREAKILRRWIAVTFIPKILPDLVREAIVIVADHLAQARAAEEVLNRFSIDGKSLRPTGSSEVAFEEYHRYQLCGDPQEYSFCSTKR